MSERKAYIVCGGATGRCVIYGYSDTEPQPGKPYRLEDARMVIYWSRECGGLLGLSMRGPQSNTKLTEVVPWTADEAARQVLPVSAQIAAMVDAWPAM